MVDDGTGMYEIDGLLLEDTRQRCVLQVSSERDEPLSRTRCVTAGDGEQLLGTVDDDHGARRPYGVGQRRRHPTGSGTDVDDRLPGARRRAS